MLLFPMEKVETEPHTVFRGCGAATSCRVAPTMYLCKSANYQIESDRAGLSAVEYTIR